MINFRALEADDLEVKVENCTANTGAEIILYKNAVIDIMLLDEAYPNKWQLIHNTKFRPDNTEEVTCTIKLYSDELKEWLEFNDVGDESMGGNPAKTAFTDSVKRAGFIIGIGRELKNKMPKLFFPFDKLGKTYGPNGDEYGVPAGDLIVTEIGYDDPISPKRRITYLKVKCISSGKFHEWDLTKDGDIQKGYTKVTNIETKQKNKKADNKTNVATPSLTSPAEAKSTNNGFMDIPEGTDEAVEYGSKVDTMVKPKEDVTTSNNTSDTQQEKVEPTQAVAPQMPKSTTPPFDENDPGSCLVTFGRFKNEGARVRDLTSVQLRHLYQHPATDSSLKKAITLYALANSDINDEFIANGIALKVS